MKSTWIKGLEGQELEEVKSAFFAGGHLRERLKELLESKIKENNKRRITKEGYESPSWGYEQADCNGYERALLEVISLISQKNED